MRIMASEEASVPRTVRTTLALPADLLAAADRLVRGGGARSRNELVADALRHELEARRRQEIDEAFSGMGDDREHEQEAERIMAEFARSDWEAWQEDERAPEAR
jgi:metal-responsive CopG/Arc/MetJ family transcriptional regulator